MIYEVMHYKCTCERCSHTWITKTENVPTMCPKCNSKLWDVPTNKTRPAESPSFVYLMQDIGTGYFKIGVSVNPRLRERTLLSQAPQILLLDYWASNTAYKHESELHAIFKDVRIRGEWFALDGDAIHHIRAFFDPDYAPAIEAAQPAQIEQPSQPIADEPKDELVVFIAKAQAKKGMDVAPITIEPEPLDEWAGWGKEEQTYDDQTGEMRTFRRHIKSGRVKWLDAETWFA